MTSPRGGARACACSRAPEEALYTGAYDSLNRLFTMSTPSPPPPPPFTPRRQRPSAVTNNAMTIFVIGIILIVVAVLEIVFLVQPWSYVTGIMTIIAAATLLIDGLGLLMGQSWALKYSGWMNKPWAQAPDVREYFGLPPAYSAYAPSVSAAAPPPPTCPTCKQPLTYVQQYQRWYCQNCQKYV